MKAVSLGCLTSSGTEVISVSQLSAHGWPRGLTARALDSESSDRGSNPRETCCAWGIKLWGARRLRCAAHQACGPPLLGPPGASSSVAEPLAVCRLQELVSSWSRGVTVSTLDSESSDRGSNPHETCACLCPCVSMHASVCLSVGQSCALAVCLRPSAAMATCPAEAQHAGHWCIPSATPPPLSPEHLRRESSTQYTEQLVSWCNG